MIGFLSGKIQENQDGKLTVFVPMGEGGVGYSVSTPSHSRYGSAPVGSKVELFVHTHVREDALELYGFTTREEKEIFLTLLTVNGIGPKGAMGILSKVELSTLVSAILNDDQDSLTDVPGIGKKTAERVVRELADPLRKKMESGMFAVPAGATATGGKKSAPALATFAAASAVFKDAKDALVGLGYREQEIVAALKKIQDSYKDPAKEAPKRAEEIVRLALKSLM